MKYIFVEVSIYVGSDIIGYSIPISLFSLERIVLGYQWVNQLNNIYIIYIYIYIYIYTIHVGERNLIRTL